MKNYSKVILGLWRVCDWNMSVNELEDFLKESIKLGINAIDTADIYCDFEGEVIIGKVFKQNKELRKELKIITKGGILFPCDYTSEWDCTVGQYNHTYDYILSQAKSSVKKLHCDYLDLYLIHRPSPLTDYDELARALNDLIKLGITKEVGVSNFLPDQFSTLQSKLDNYDIKLVTNQVEMSAKCLEHFKNGNIESFSKNNISPMAWSPLAGGSIFKEQDNLNETLNNIKDELNVENIDEIAYAFLATHPVDIKIVIGTGKLNRVTSAIKGSKIKLSNDQWFRIYIASQGHNMA